MTVISLIIGMVFGFIWGSLFTSKQRSNKPVESSSLKASAWFLASTSVIRYLLLACLLALLVKKYDLSLPFWTVGFLFVFWATLTRGAALPNNDQTSISKSKLNKS